MFRAEDRMTRREMREELSVDRDRGEGRAYASYQEGQAAGLREGESIGYQKGMADGIAKGISICIQIAEECAETPEHLAEKFHVPVDDVKKVLRALKKA